MDAPRTLEQRKSDALAKLTAREADVWVASVSRSGQAYLVPLSCVWDGEYVILSTEASTVTARNIADTRQMRLALGTTRDVVMTDAVFVRQLRVADAPLSMAEHYASQAGWDPRSEAGDYLFLTVRPERIQVWREANEIAVRTVMRGGVWLS